MELFIVKKWIEGETIEKDVESSTIFTTKENAELYFSKEKKSILLEYEILKDEESYLEYKFKENDIICTGYITLENINIDKDYFYTVVLETKGPIINETTNNDFYNKNDAEKYFDKLKNDILKRSEIIGVEKIMEIEILKIKTYLKGEEHTQQLFLFEISKDSESVLEFSFPN